ncbi:MAG: MoaD/ThiS family protein [Sandaracinaceae bacterium]|nr:MoaD/ThiS family protein [Sandaracinaceae bacterium]
MFQSVTEPEITIRYFAGARELAGLTEERLPLGEVSSHAALRASLATRHPALAPLLGAMRFAVNDAFVGTDYVPVAGDRVDVLPPVAGGSLPLAEVRSTPLSIDEIYRAVSHAGAGGVTLFVGVVRDVADGKPVARLDYEQHPTFHARRDLAVLRRVQGELASGRRARRRDPPVGRATAVGWTTWWWAPRPRIGTRRSAAAASRSTA